MQRSQLDPVIAGRAGVDPVLTVADLAVLCETPWGLESYSPLLDQHYLLLDASHGASQPDIEQLQHVANTLRLLPCPVIALGAVRSPELLRGVDVVVAGQQEAATLLGNITAHPLAAATLVQLLRHNEDVAPSQGLLAESMAYATLQGSGEFKQVMKNTALPPRVEEDPRGALTIERSGDALLITLNRPDARNAYSTAMRDALYEALQLLKVDRSLRRAVLSGAGSCFSIGGDLSEFDSVPDAATAHAIRSRRNVGLLLHELSAQLEFRLHRACIGSGLELAAFAARIVAHRNTFMQLPEIKLGLVPGAGGTVSILRRIGRQRLAYLALSARRISAETALQWGLIDAIV